MADKMTNQNSGDNAEHGESLYSLDNHAARRRVPAWQQAALMRAKGWAEGKMLTDAEYDLALNELKFRRMGSGRAA